VEKTERTLYLQRKQSSQVRIFLRLVWGEWTGDVTGKFSAGLFILGIVVGTAGLLGAPPTDSKIVVAASWIVAIGAGFRAVYKVWLGEHKKNVKLIEDFSSKVNISVSDNNGISEDVSNGMVTKRVQLVVDGITSAPLVNCEARMERVIRLDTRIAVSLIEEPMRFEWSHVGEDDKFKTTIPEGIPKRVNLFAISGHEGRLIPLAEFYKEQLALGINIPGRYRVDMAISAAGKTKTLKQSFILEWQDFYNITLRDEDG
jgi:hypothetical protein